MTGAARLARASTVVGLLVAGLGAAFVVRAIQREGSEVATAVEGAGAGWLLAAVPVAFGAVTLIGLLWWRTLDALGASAPVRPLLFWYFAGQLGKYIPGTVWPVVGRAELAGRAGIPRPAAYGSVVLSLGATYLAASLLVAVLLPLDLDDRRSVATVAAVVFVPLGFAAIHPRVLGSVRAVAERLVRRPVAVPVPSWPVAAGLVVAHAPAWLLIGAATWLVARAYEPSAGLHEVGFAAIVSWIVGFAVVPAPGGLGVREAAFVAAVDLGSAGVAAAVALTARVLFMVVDLSGAAVATLLWRSLPGGAPPPPAAVRPGRPGRVGGTPAPRGRRAGR